VLPSAATAWAGGLLPRFLMGQSRGPNGPAAGSRAPPGTVPASPAGTGRAPPASRQVPDSRGRARTMRPSARRCTSGRPSHSEQQAAGRTGRSRRAWRVAYRRHRWWRSSAPPPRRPHRLAQGRPGAATDRAAGSARNAPARSCRSGEAGAGLPKQKTPATSRGPVGCLATAQPRSVGYAGPARRGQRGMFATAKEALRGPWPGKLFWKNAATLRRNPAAVFAVPDGPAKVAGTMTRRAARTTGVARRARSPTCGGPP
jgi:hypothetical protein